MGILMNHTLEQLIKLQEIDQRLLEIKDFMGDLPSTVETQEQEVETMELDNESKLKKITEIDPDIIHSHMGRADIFSALSKTNLIKLSKSSSSDWLRFTNVEISLLTNFISFQ